MFDSNHCPGSVMYLFRGVIGTVLHTGDFRYSWRLFSKYPLLYPKDWENENLRGISVPIDHLIVDSTFGDPNIIFPAQDDAMKTIEEIATTHFRLKNKIHTFTYTIGKEEIFVWLAKMFDTKIGVDEKWYRQMLICNYDPKLFTT